MLLAVPHSRFMATKAKAAIAEPLIDDETTIDETYDETLPDLEDEGDEDEQASACSFDPTDEDDEEGEPERLTGQELLDFVAQEKEKGRTVVQMAFDAGYRMVTKDGSERTLKAQFSQALLAAQGLDFDGPGTGGGTRTRAGMKRAKANSQCLIQVSQVAARAIGVQPGSVLTIDFPTGDLVGPGAQILLTLTDEVIAITPRRRGEAPEEPGAPLLDQTA